MPSFFSVTKKTLFIGLGLLLFSLTEAKPSSKLRSKSSLGDNDDPDYGCWIESYGRGVGKPVTTCPNGLENDASLCYTPCRSGFSGAGPVCWESCPAGFKDTGADCLKPSSYGRGTGYAANHQSKCQQENPQGCEKNGAFWYPKCAANFHNVECCVCSPNCPSGMLDIGVSCQKQSYGRGVGKPLVCTADQDENAGLCYKQCKAGYSGDGPICWGSCPSGMYQCGALCVPAGIDCTNDMLEIANEVMQGMHEAAEEEDSTGTTITVAQTGVDVGTKLAKYGMCNNL